MSVSRRVAVFALVGGISGCLGRFAEDGNGDRTEDNPALAAAVQQGNMSLTSPAFDDGAMIPERYGYDRENVNPPLEIDGVPEHAASLVLVVDDPDAVEPAGRIWVHWLVWNVPPGLDEVPEGWTAEQATEGENDFAEVGYGGPSPPEGEHTYRFKLFALDDVLDLEAGASVDELGPAMREHVIARTRLTGRFGA